MPLNNKQNLSNINDYNFLRFGLVAYYGISTIEGNFMPNPVYTSSSSSCCRAASTNTVYTYTLNTYDAMGKFC